jgi:hypothetical protein
MRKIFTILICLLLVGQIQAQYKPVIFGLRVGSNIGWIKPNTEEYSSEGIKPGFAWGFIGEFYFMENYALSTGFNMLFIGGKLEYPYLEMIDDVLIQGTLHRKYNVRYLQIPLTLKMKTELNEQINIFGKIGIGTAFCLGAKADDEFQYEGGSYSDSKKDIIEDIALMRESLIVGGGVEFKIKGSTAIIAELSYDNDFNNILTDANPAVADEPKAILNFVELGVGIVF